MGTLGLLDLLLKVAKYYICRVSDKIRIKDLFIKYVTLWLEWYDKVPSELGKLLILILSLLKVNS